MKHRMKYTLGYADDARKRSAYLLTLAQNAAAKYLYERRRRGSAAIGEPSREKPVSAPVGT